MELTSVRQGEAERRSDSEDVPIEPTFTHQHSHLFISKHTYYNQCKYIKV